MKSKIIYICLSPVFLWWLFFFSNNSVRHFTHLMIWHDVYERAINYYKTCGKLCNIKMTWKWCGEGKQCYRDFSDDRFSDILDETNLWMMTEIVTWSIVLTVYSSIDDSSDFFWWGASYSPVYQYLYVYDVENIQHILATLKKTHIKIIRKFNTHRYILYLR